MSGKYHINRKGVAAPCRAKNNCPLGAAYGDKTTASNAASDLEKEYLGVDKDFYKNTEKSGDYSEVSKHIDTATKEDLEPLNKQIQEYRNSDYNGDELRRKEYDSMRKLNELVNNKNRELLDSEEGQELNKVRDKVKEIDEHLKEGPDYDKKKEKEALLKGLVEKSKELQRRAASEAEASEEYKAEEENLQAIKREGSIRRYIEIHNRSEDGLTPIERSYNAKGKDSPTGIKKDIGVNKIAMKSSQLKPGGNEIKEDLVVDGKGRITNLYADYNGTTKRVVALNEDSDGNIEFEDGTKMTISEGSNFKKSGLTSVSGINFHTTPPRGKKKYEGYNKIIFNKFDSGD